MTKVSCKLLEERTINEKQYLVFSDLNDSSEYIVPFVQIGNCNLRQGDVMEFNKTYNKKWNKFFLDNIDYTSHYKVDITYEFKINDFHVIDDQKGKLKYIVNVILDNGIIVDVLASQWHTLALWKFDTFKCRISRFSPQGVPVLIANDNRHPFFEVGQVYPFQVISKFQKTNKNSKKEFSLYEVLAIDGLRYEVPITSSQLLSEELVESIECRVLAISHIVNLSQINVRDPYFVTIEKIVQDKILINKYFKPFFENNTTDFNILKLIEQYSSESAFWIFTYCNKVLPKIFFEYIGRYDYKSAFQINELIISFEEWIIKRGILQSFSNLELKHNSLNKATLQLQKRKVIKEVLQILIDSKSCFYYSIIENGSYKLDIQRLQCVLQFSNFALINHRFYIIKLIELTSNVVLSETDLFYLNLSEYLIRDRKKQFSNINSNEYFTLTDNTNYRFINDSSREKYFEWSFCLYHINNCLGDFKTGNLLIARMLREYFHGVADVHLKQSLLYNAFYILNANDVETTSNHPVIYSESKGVEIHFSHNNPNHLNYHRSDWADVWKSFNSNQTLKVSVFKRTFGGFEAKYNSLIGFLPSNHIYDYDIKGHVLNEIDYTIAASCILINEPFNIFILKQIPGSDAEYYSFNNNSVSIKKGLYSEGRVRNIETFGVFVNTLFGVALLHYSNISWHHWTKEKLSQYFKVGERINFVILDIHEGKIDIGIKQLKGSIYDTYYTNFLNKLESPVLDYLEPNESIFENYDKYENLENDIQMEKAFCFEQYALTQNDFDDKINTLRLAKQLYSSINSSRSFLINIFTDYFQILLLVQYAIENYTLQNWQSVKNEVSKVKDKINKRTIETFPDSDKLIYFLDIISLFNEKSNESIEKLYNYIKEYSLDINNSILKTIAKVTLSNNLMISETMDDFDFSVKNLKIINSYIVSGVFSLKESESDRLEREINEIIKYWRDKIQQDEGQELEFKQTYITPILDGKRKKVLQVLEMQSQTNVVKKEISRLNGIDATRAIKHSALKTLAAFANSKGGSLLLGVSDNKKITGLEIDYLSLKQQDRDGFGKKFDEDVKTYLGESFSSILDKKYVKFPEGDVLIIVVQPSVDIVFLLKDEEANACEDVYIRHLSSTVLLTGKELLKFYNLRNRKNDFKAQEIIN